MAISTVRKGRDEARRGPTPEDVVKVRRGAGKRPYEVAHPEVWPALDHDRRRYAAGFFRRDPNDVAGHHGSHRASTERLSQHVDGVVGAQHQGSSSFVLWSNGKLLVRRIAGGFGTISCME
jgi:hypothetical protein